VPSSHTSAEVCLTAWPDARPQGWDKRDLSFEREVCIRAKGGNGGGNWRGLVQ